MRDRVFQVSLPASLAIQPSGPRRGRAKTLNHLMVLAALTGCNGHPLAPLEDDLVATRRQEFVLAARPAVDFLFVVDASGSMVHEQATLARNMADFADYFVGTQGAFDFRIAVTTPDLSVEAPGHFVTGAAPAPVPGQAPSPIDLAECAALEAAGLLGPVLAPDALEEACAEDTDADGCLRAELARRFQCLAVRGATGNGIERGLEAMRQALSCGGPNRALFGECCDSGTYDPACQPTRAPDFLRPEARLVVVIVSDEDDCSEVPNSTLSQEDQRDCLWQRDQLVPVADYVRFLRSLKAQPQEQVLVATVVGHDVFTEADALPTYAPGVPPLGCDANQPGTYDPSLTLEQCCPGGVCLGGARVVCPGTGAAAGTRYLELARTLGGLGCPAGAEGTAGCLSVCSDDFAGPVQQILDAARQQRFCLDRRPACTADAACDALQVSVIEDEVRRILPPEGVVYDPAALDCGSGAAVSLATPPLPGARIIVDYRVETP